MLDIHSYQSPCIITGDSLRPDMLLSTAEKCFYIIELTVGFETNLNNNAHRKELKYLPLLTDRGNDYQTIESINLSMSCIVISCQSSESFIKICTELGFDNHHLRET